MFSGLLKQLKTSFETTTPVPEQSREEALRLATAVLMAEVARADTDFDEREFELMIKLVQRHFGLTPEDAVVLANSANESAENSISLHDFTQLLHDTLTLDEKAQIVLLLWQIAYADGRLDKYESSMVRKISDLLHVPNTRMMHLKHQASGEGDNAS